MDKHAQGTDDEVDEMVEKLKVHHHGFVASCESSSVAHKTYQEDDFITHLKHKLILFYDQKQCHQSLILIILKRDRAK